MRWDNFDEKFQRPIRWIVSIMDNKEVPIEIINVKSGKVSRGHRFSKIKQLKLITQMNTLKNFAQQMLLLTKQKEKQKL